MKVSTEEVLNEFAKMQQARGHSVTETHIKKFSIGSWTKQKVNPQEIITPYSEFRELVNYSRRRLTNKEALEEIKKSNNTQSLALLKEPLNNPPPIMLFMEDKQLILEDGAKRSLSACFQGITKIDAYVRMRRTGFEPA